jgi:uncharacterized protein YjiS (DUF1127 family)
MFLNRLLTQIGERRRRRVATMEIAHMNEYQLQDLGITRLDIIAGRRPR